MSHGIFPELRGESFIFLSNEQLDLERETIVPFWPQSHLSSMSILAKMSGYKLFTNPISFTLQAYFGAAVFTGGKLGEKNCKTLVAVNSC